MKFSGECRYCGGERGDDGYNVHEAVKPPRSQARYEYKGACCRACEAKGKPVFIDKWKGNTGAIK